jgi:hypothetical protein
VLEDEIRLSEALYKERHGDFTYVTLENVALFERQARDVANARQRLQTMDLDRFKTIEEFKQHVLASLRELYESRAMFRAGIRMLMECVRDLTC